MSNEKGIAASNGPTPSYGVTEAGGSYNRHAATQLAGATLALPLLEKAAQDLLLNAGDQPVVIADYGCSQGKNSLAPIRAAIAVLRKRISRHRPICVVHVDVAENDFTTLFEVLDTAPDSYFLDDPDVFPSAVGRSFYHSVLPPDHVHLGWSSYAAVWLSRIPAMIPDHIWPASSTGEVHAAFERQAAQDWETFLALRARELRSGGKLVVVLPGIGDDVSSAAKSRLGDMMDHANSVLSEMVAYGLITTEERVRMVLPSYPRRRSELLAPFGQGRRFGCLLVEHCAVFPFTDAAWTEYERDGDDAGLAARHAGFFRAAFLPTLASALAPDRGAEGRQSFIDRLAEGLRRRLVGHPAPLQLLAQVIVLAKQAAT
ncbi:MAG: hypothetical protein JO110_26590 [Acetobacteraceae bacterium]|nr:hypothetical protein [Acetobacteraceae bacterium]